MINPFIIKKWVSLLIMSFVPLLTFVMTQLFFGFYVAVGMFLFMTIMMMMISNKLLANPFTMMLEGKGLLLFKIDSTGIIRPFVASVNSPYIQGKIGRKKITDIFNRKAVFSLTTPGKAEAEMDEKNKKLTLNLSEDDFNNSRFGMYHYPVLLYNDQIKSLITKDFLSKQELKIFSDHGVLYLNRKIEELSGHLRDFGRYVVESLKPGNNLLANYLSYFVIGGVILLLLVLFGPQIMASLQGGAGGAIGGAVGSATQAVAVAPLP